MNGKNPGNGGWAIASSDLLWATQSVDKHTDECCIGSSDSSLGLVVDDLYVTRQSRLANRGAFRKAS